MNKLFKYACLISLFTISFSFANNPQFGLKLGLGGSHMSIDVDGEDAENINPKFSYALGATSLFPVSEKFKVNVDLLWISRGFSQEIDLGVGTVDQVTNFNYLSLPILGQLNLDGFLLFAGPEIAIYMNGKMTAEADSDLIEIEDDEEDLEDVTSVDFGLTMGLGYQFTENVQVDARFYYGFGDAEDSDAPITANHRSYGLTLGYLF